MDLPDKCACSGSNLDRFLQPIILSILKEEHLTGYMIIKRISEYSTFRNNRPDPTGVYRYLKIMCDRELLNNDAPCDGDKGGATPYRITPMGEKCLVRWCQTLRDYCDKVNKLILELEAS